MSADHTGGDTGSVVAKDVRAENIDDSHDGHEDAGSECETPKWHGELGLTGFSVRELAEDGDAEEQLRETEHDEAMSGTEEWPVAAKV